MRTVEKPWGKEEIWGETDKYLGKFLYINAGEMLSRQYHEVKEETICVLEGKLCLEKKKLSVCSKANSALRSASQKRQASKECI
jgi:mannose-6-phosphate isomerase-like protein (cupin superfamily)